MLKITTYAEFMAEAERLDPEGFAKSRADRAEADALRKDAERYRWLRKNPQWLGWEHDFRPDEVDRELDAAMR